jgi:hypothetical protein
VVATGYKGRMTVSVANIILREGTTLMNDDWVWIQKFYFKRFDFKDPGKSHKPSVKIVDSWSEIRNIMRTPRYNYGARKL